MTTTDVVSETVMLTLMGALSVSLWTIRVALTARGRRGAASAAAGIEAVVFALVFSSVLTSLNAPVEIAGYAVGVAGGTMLGVLTASRLSTGQSAVRIIVDGSGQALTTELRARGWPVTRLPAEGLHGSAALLLLVVDDAQLSRTIRDVERLAGDAFWTTERLGDAHPTVLLPGYRQVGRRRPTSWRTRRGHQLSTTSRETS